MKYSFAVIALVNSALAVNLSRHHHRHVPGVTFIESADDVPERPFNDGTTAEGST